MFSSEAPGLITSYGLCILCKKKAEWMCQRCMDFYCSSECQRKDWQRHRFICFAMPGLRPASYITPEPHYLQTHRGHLINHVNCVHLSSSEIIGNLNSKVFDTDKKSVDEIVKVPKIKSSEEVVLLGFISSNICFVRPLKHMEAHIATLKKIDSIGKCYPKLDTYPTAHTVALTPYNGILSRLEVLAVEDDKHVKVLYCDYGIVASVKVSDLRVATEDILKMPRFSFMVKLYNVNDFSMNESLVSFLHKFQGMECEMRYLTVSDKEPEVEFCSLNSKKNINNEIAKYCSKIDIKNVSRSSSYTVCDKKLEKKEAMMTNDGSKDELLVDLSQDVTKQTAIQTFTQLSTRENTGEKPITSPPFDIYLFKTDLMNFKVLVLDTSALDYGYIGCIAETDLKYLVNVQEYLARYTDVEKAYTPKLHEYCLARFENEWYRARVVKVIDHLRYTVVYLDFTNESVLTCQDIRRYPLELNVPCRTNLCLIDGLPTSLKDEHINFLKKEISTESKLVIDKIKEVVQQIVVIECESIIKKMKNIGLL